MDEINKDLNKFSLSTSKHDVREVVAADVMSADEEFYNYIYLSNEKYVILIHAHLQQV